MVQELYVRIKNVNTTQVKSIQGTYNLLLYMAFYLPYNPLCI